VCAKIAGEAGAGKTQTALCLALQAQLPVEQGGLGGKTAYLCCGEGDFPIRRYAQLAAVWEVRTQHRGGVCVHPLICWLLMLV